jgi:membrane protease YdiL (CAAX protease family)
MEHEWQRRNLLLMAFGFEGGLALLAWVLGWLLGYPAFSTLNWNTQGVFWGLVACLPMLVLFLICLRWPVGPLAGIKQFADEVIRPVFTPCSWLDLALISLLAGIGEELLFRGVIQGALGDWLGPWLGLALASLLFGVVHWITPTYALLATVMGAYLGWAWLASGNLLVVIVAHAVYDWVALLVLVHGRSEKGPSTPATE